MLSRLSFGFALFAVGMAAISIPSISFLCARTGITKGGFLLLFGQFRGSRADGKSCGTRGRSARSSGNYLSCLCACGHGCLHLCVGLHREGGCLHPAKGHSGSLLKSDSSDGHACSYRTVGWTPAPFLPKTSLAASSSCTARIPSWSPVSSACSQISCWPDSIYTGCGKGALNQCLPRFVEF